MGRSSRLPTPLTPFFGRSIELRTIQRLLKEPGCRLLTLVGPGGIGKTRLALEAARALANDYPHDIVFVDLQSVASEDLLPVAVNHAMGIAPNQAAPLEQLVRYIAGRQVLLVFDNFEHLLGSAGQLTYLLMEAPGLKMIVTSREALNLQEEWLYSVGGMDLPADKTSRQNWREEAQSTSAVQLFAACARRARPEFSLDEELENVVEVCQLVEGMPLAIELAAAWARMLRCEVIAREIKGNIHFLASSLRNIPERHRSIQVVFDQAWRMLSPEEQQAFQRLSVFRGGFDQTAAQHIAEADLVGLLKLVDKSLLRWAASPASGESRDAVERFALHELLRQFAQDRLSQTSAEQDQTHKRHCDYYLNFLRQRDDDLLGGRQQAAVQEIHEELENIRAAWKWAAQQNRCEILQHAVQPLDAYFQFQSRFREGARLFEQTLQELENHPACDDRLFTQAQLQVCLGWYYIRLGKFNLAETAFKTAELHYKMLAYPPPSQLGSDPLAGLAVLAVLRGAYSEAVAMGEEVKRTSETNTDSLNLLFAHYILAGAWLAHGAYETARQHAQEACERAQAAKNAWLLAYGLNEWGHALCALQDTRQARQLYEESYRIRKTFNDPEGMALALSHLGKVALLEENYLEAQHFYQESYAIYATIFDQGGLSAALNGLGNSALGLNKLDESRNYLAEALRVASEIRFVPLVISVLLSTADLFIKTGQRERGLELLRFTYTSPASDQPTRRAAGEKLDHHRHRSAAENATGSETSAIQTARPMKTGLSQKDLDGMVKELLAEIENLSVETPKSLPDRNPTLTGLGVPEAQNRGMAITEPLTDREIQILQYMNEGLSNKSIAEQLILSLGTVKWYTSQIYGKLHITSRTQAIAKGREMGIL